MSWPDWMNWVGSARPRIHGYELICQLGRGGMGVVWKARQLGTNRDVALKLLRPPAFDRCAERRFEREVELAARLDHPHIARVYHSGIHEGVYAYAMELVAGTALDQYAGKANLSRAGVLRLMRTVCRAVQYAHQKGVIHRDLKPSNILVTDDGQPKVLDFGLAKSYADPLAALSPGAAAPSAGPSEGTPPGAPAGPFGAQSETRAEPADRQDFPLTVPGSVAGTPAFMSPEQADGYGDHADVRSDVYSLGVILYRLLTGKSPHDLSGGASAVARRVSREPVIPPRRSNADVGYELEAVLLMALAKDPDGRYPSAGDLAADIDRLLRGMPVVAVLASPDCPRIYPLRKWGGRNRRRLAFAAATALILGGVGTSVSILFLQREAIHKDTYKKLGSEQLRNEVAEAQRLISEGPAPLDARRAAEAAGDIRQGLARLGKCAPAPDIAAQLRLLAHLRLGEIYARTGIPLAATGVLRHELLAVGFHADEPGGGKLMVWDELGVGRHWDPIRGGPMSNDLPSAGLKMASVCLAPGRQYAAFLSNAGAQSMCLQVCPLGPPGTGAPSPATPVLINFDLRSAFAVSSDGKRVLGICRKTYREAGGADDGAGEQAGPLGLFDAGSGKQALDLAAAGEATRVAFCPGRSTALAGDAGGRLKLIDLGTSEILRELSSPAAGAGPVTALVVTGDGTAALTGHGNGWVIAWDLRSGGTARVLRAGPGPAVQSLAVSDDGELALSGDREGGIKLWGLRDGACRGDYSLPGEVKLLALSPDNRFFVSGGADQVLRSFSLGADFGGPRDLDLGADAQCLAVSAQSGFALAGGPDGAVVLLDVAGAVPPRRLAPGHRSMSQIRAVSFSPDGATAYAGDRDGRVLAWDVASGAVTCLAAGGQDVDRMAFSPDGKWVLSVEWNSLKLTHLSDGTAGPTLPSRDLVARFAIFSPDSRRILVVADNGAARLLEVGRDQPIWEASGADAQVLGTSFSADGKLLLMAKQDNPTGLSRLEVWDATTPTPTLLAQPPTTAGHVSCLTTGPGHTVFTGGADGSLELWDLADPRSPRPIYSLLRSGPSGGVVCTAFGDAADKSVVLAARDGRRFTIWVPSRAASHSEP